MYIQYDMKVLIAFLVLFLVGLHCFDEICCSTSTTDSISLASHEHQDNGSNSSSDAQKCDCSGLCAYHVGANFCTSSKGMIGANDLFLHLPFYYLSPCHLQDISFQDIKPPSLTIA